MYILTLRTDKPVAEMALYKDEACLTRRQWQAHRALAETIHATIAAELGAHNLDWHDIQGLVVYQGPGSFTGLRIGLSVANAWAASYQLPIVGSQGEDWEATGVARLKDGMNDGQVQPEYGAPVHITMPKK